MWGIPYKRQQTTAQDDSARSSAPAGDLGFAGFRGQTLGALCPFACGPCLAGDRGFESCVACVAGSYGRGVGASHAATCAPCAIDAVDHDRDPATPCAPCAARLAALAAVEAEAPIISARLCGGAWARVTVDRILESRFRHLVYSARAVVHCTPGVDNATEP